MSAGHTKSELRSLTRRLLKTMPPAERAAASAAACRRLREQPVWRQARAVLFYAPLPGELDLSPMLEEALSNGKTVALPRFIPAQAAYGVCQIMHLEQDCVPGKYDIAEPGSHCPPFPLKQLDFVLVPGLGFDSSGHRLGRGQGYYDRLLGGVAATKCGVAFDGQMLGALPAEAHDVRMNFILTPTQWLVIPR